MKGSVTKNLREGKQQLPLYNVCVFFAVRKQIVDPRKDLKQQIGTVQAQAFCISREKRKRGMDAETFDMVSWDDIESVLKGTSRMLKM